MNICMVCQQHVGETSIDVMSSRTIYDESGEPDKTMEPVDDIGIVHDYITVCERPVCRQRLVNAWTNFLGQLK